MTGSGLPRPLGESSAWASTDQPQVAGVVLVEVGDDEPGVDLDPAMKKVLTRQPINRE